MLKLIVDGEKFEALLNSLREAKARHIDPEAEDGGRLAAINALDAALQFIRSLPGVEEERLHIPLTSLSGALLDYTDGRNPRLFDRSTTACSRLNGL